jgi:hypothetical protein
MIAGREQWTQGIEDARKRAQALVSGLTAEQLTKRPDPAKWGIAECIVHLNMTASDHLPLIAEAIQRARERKLFGQGPFDLGILGPLLMRITTDVKVPAPRKVAHPVPTGDASGLLSDFMRVQDEWARLIQQAEGLNLEKIKIRSPYYFGLLRTRLCANFSWLIAHQRRHLLQAENIKKHILPPAST